MDKQSIEEQLKTIEAAINSAQARHLPAVRRTTTPAVVPGSIHEKDTRASQELALVILKRFNDRITTLEHEGMTQQHHIIESAAIQQEQTEAIDLIGQELATLKHRTAELESWLRTMHVRDTVHLLQRNNHASHRDARITWGIFAILGFILGLLLLALHWL
jgi:hypothetical protein